MIKKFDKYIKEKLSFFPKTMDEIDRLCKKYEIENYSINKDMSINVYEDVFLKNRGLRILPLDFYNVSGDFECSENMLITLEGCPKYIGGDLKCHDNNLISMNGCANRVEGSIYAYQNKLKTLEGSAEYVGGIFSCFRNKLETFKGGPKTIIGNIYCYENHIYTAAGFPSTMYGNIRCESNPIYEIISLFENDREKYSIGKVFEVWNSFDPVREKKGKWYVDSVRLKELYYYLTGEDSKKEFIFSNYITE